MRKRVIACLVLTLVVLFASSIAASSAEYADEINDAFNCLDDEIGSKTLSLEEAVFAALTKSPSIKVNNTMEERKSSSEECWPNSGCNLKDTSQVLLAKMRQGEDVELIVDWIKSKSGVTPELTWYLQISIDNNEASECVVNYDDVDYDVGVEEDMTLSGNPGSCLSITPSGYWLSIDGGCLEKQFNVQCDKGFKTNLLYQKSTGGVIYVSSQTHGAAGGAWTLEEITAKCFKTGANCDYEGSLWAAAALYATDEDIGVYAPYLRALASDNERYFPSAFLVAILEGGDDHYSNIINSQRIRPEGAYWEMPLSPYGRYYDTSLAMMALGGGDSAEIENANTLDYLFTNQDSSGCWNGNNIRDTAFLIYAAGWQRTGGDVPPQDPVCGNGVLESGEQCDCGDGGCSEAQLDGKNCTDRGFNGGDIGCFPAGTPDECEFNTTMCTGDVDPVCGDGEIEGDEMCDCGDDGVCTSEELDEKACSDVESGLSGDGLSCNMVTCEFNTTECFTSDDPDLPGGNETINCTDDEDCPEGMICEDEICVDGGSGDGPYDPGTLTDCELEGLYCVSQSACLEAGGQYFPQETHACSNHLEYCCTVDAQEATCSSLGGSVCPYDQPCTTSTVIASDGPCCVEGICQTDFEECASDDDCDSGEICDDGDCVEENFSECDDEGDCGSGEVCDNGDCVSSGDDGGSSLWVWIIVLVILIILVVLGILYRDRIKVWWHDFRSKSKSKKVKPGSPPPGMPMGRRPPPRFGPPGMRRPMTSRRPMMRPGRGRPNPPQRRQDNSKKSDKEKEMDETFKKLKEMSE